MSTVDTTLLPIRICGRLDGDAGSGRSAPTVALTPRGVAVSRLGRLSLHTDDLARETWACAITGRVARPLVSENVVWASALPGRIVGVDLSSGEGLRRIDYAAPGVLRGRVADTLLVVRPKELEALDTSGRRLWARSVVTPRHILGINGSYVLSQNLGTQVLCIDALSGSEKWRFEPPVEKGREDRRFQTMAAGFPSVSTVGDDVLAITMDCRVFRISVETGEVVGRGRSPVSGVYAVTQDAVYFKTPFVLSEFSHRDFVEVNRIEHRTETEPLYHGAEPSVNGVCVTPKTAIWTTMDGALMAVSRTEGPGGRRRVWMERLPGAIIAISDAPVAGTDYFYYTKKSPEGMELLCFGGLQAAG